MKTDLLLAIAAALCAVAPLTAAGPVVCSGTCTIQGGSTGFVPPVQVVDSGTDVNWVPNDGNAHANTDSGTSDPCFFAPFGPDGSTHVRFDIVGASLEATVDPAGPNATTAPCANAAALPGGGFVLQYFCVLHPVLMKGALVVVPAA